MQDGFQASARRGDNQLSVATGLSARSLQRLFADYVGVSPKWVMRRADCMRRPRGQMVASRSTGPRWLVTSAMPTRRT